MQKSIYLAKSLLILSYSLLFLLIVSILSISVWEPLFQASFFVLFIALIGLSYESLYSAFLQALGSSRVDSALRRIGGVADIIDNLHEYTDLDALLRYTQYSLAALLGGGSANLMLARNYLEADDSGGGRVLAVGVKKPSDFECKVCGIKLCDQCARRVSRKGLPGRRGC